MMLRSIKYFAIIAGLSFSLEVMAQSDTAKPYQAPYRPQEHFSPKAHWMNDPNGMIYFDHTYHLFYQYYPDGTTWGPMHWGHTVSKDLIHWQELPIALYPDSLGYIFSGSAVVDSNNTSGFGKNGKIPMVAIFTHHDPVGAKEGKNNFQNESLAYSLDDGYTWTKYAGNPVLKNPGIIDFRDPKVNWYPVEKKWVMTLATKDRVTFYSSPNLKDWKKESEFGARLGAHGGVWECPDLFPLKLNGKTHWVLIVNLNPGGPNGGSATQYFIGQFDGNKFTADDTKTRWVDYGPDEYAGVTWGNTGNRKIFLGWMSNWEYANQVPTKMWRNAMTIPREISLKQVNGEILLASVPVKELKNAESEKVSDLYKTGVLQKSVLKLTTNDISNYSITLYNNSGNKVIIGYDAKANQYYIDRTKSGNTGFQKHFSGTFTAPRLATAKKADLTLVIDAASVELFADNGLTVMTAIYFPEKPLDKINVKHANPVLVKLIALKSIWKP